MAVNCGVSFGVCTVRITKLNANGSVSAATPNSYVSDKPTSIAVNPNYETGQTFTARSGCGCSIARFKAINIFNWLDLVYTSQAVEPLMMDLMTGETNITSGVDVLGVNSVGAFPCSQSLPFVAIEFWTEHVVGSAQDATDSWIHWVIPRTTWQLGNATHAEAITPVPLDGYSGTNALWGRGPYGDGPPDGSNVTEWAYWKTNVTPPTAACAGAFVTPSS